MDDSLPHFMPRLLTIAIPTYKRAAQLDQQLTWLDRSIRGLEDACNIIVSDNASPDDTPEVCRKWQHTFAGRGAELFINRNPRNIGPLPNISRCIELATSRFTWVVGDDDQIPDHTLGWVLTQLLTDPELALIVMNFAGIGKTVYPRCFEFDRDRLGDGREVISDCLRQAYFGLAFMTAQVYRTEYAQAALRAWPQGRANYDYQVFITAVAGLHGRVLATRDTHVTYVTGDNIYETNKRVGLKLYADTLDVFVHLARAGYSARLCRQLARRHLWDLKKRFIKRALQNNPILTIATLARAARYLAQLSATRFVNTAAD